MWRTVGQNWWVNWKIERKWIKVGKTKEKKQEK